ncbi:butyrophilin subfamily 2 member A1-like [Aphelocoma coerulescens]|uniref:butyrophilin subfamily 2 member A1-like n=1 Tax=Aphelocoma coerulescens TaxID=39617 RepID=UPI003604BA7A
MENPNQPPLYPKTGGFLSAPKTSVLGIIGDRVVLPCQVGSAPIPEDFSIRWTFHGQSQRIPVSSYDGKDRREELDERYQGRAEFFHRDFRAGNLSLLLRSVQSSDQGSYSCEVSFQNVSREVLVELEVAAIGEAPSVILRSPEKQDLVLSCRASGWFPRPELLWLDRHGKVRRESMTTTATVTPGGLFSIEASLRIQPGSDLEISCRILNRRLNASRESRIRIHDVFLPSISQWLRIFLAVLFLNMALISIVFCQIRGSNKRTMGAGQMKAELDFWEARSHAVPVALDPEARPLDLGDAQDPLRVPVLLARDALRAGKRYWEVELPRERDWALGVLRDGPSLPGPHSRHSRHCWALRASQGQLFSSGSSSRLLREQSQGLSALGVFLDSEEERLEFYDVEQRDLVAGMSLGAGEDPSGKFFPFVSQGEEGTLRIRPVPMPVPL